MCKNIRKKKISSPKDLLVPVTGSFRWANTLWPSGDKCQSRSTEVEKLWAEKCFYFYFMKNIFLCVWLASFGCLYCFFFCHLVVRLNHLVFRWTLESNSQLRTMVQWLLSVYHLGLKMLPHKQQKIFLSQLANMSSIQPDGCKAIDKLSSNWWHMTVSLKWWLVYPYVPHSSFSSSVILIILKVNKLPNKTRV